MVCAVCILRQSTLFLASSSLSIIALYGFASLPVSPNFAIVSLSLGRTRSISATILLWYSSGLILNAISLVASAKNFLAPDPATPPTFINA